MAKKILLLKNKRRFLSSSDMGKLLFYFSLFKTLYVKLYFMKHDALESNSYETDFFTKENAVKFLIFLSNVLKNFINQFYKCLKCEKTHVGSNN